MGVSCPNCDAVNPEGARFCANCGSPQGAVCPRCGTETPEGARFCPSCGHALSAPPPRIEERKLVTVLFADVSESTALGELLDPERLKVIFAEYFAAMAEVIEDWGGTVEKFIGDAVMAAFGVPVVREDDANRALYAALGMLDRLEEINDGFRKRHGVTLAIRIGVNTGEVIAPVGERVEELIVAGDAVNVAARLQTAAEPGTVLVGPRTVAAAREAFEFGEPESLEVKGKAFPVEARRLLRVLPEPRRGLLGLTASMVGRDRELALLMALAEESRDRSEPRMALVYGPAGIGKSRLVWELVRASTSNTQPPRVLRGRCLPVGEGITYWALAEILRAACEIKLDDGVGMVQAKLRSGLDKTLGRLGLTSAEAEEATHALAVSAGIDLPNGPLRRLEPNAVAKAIGRAWPRFVSGLAASGPVVLVIEDVHWAGNALVEMLERLVTRVAGPALFLITARPEFGARFPHFGTGSVQATTIPLQPLTSAQSAQLVEELLAVADLPEPFRLTILERAEGNPFFLEEILRRLIDQQLIVHESGRWRAAEPGTPIELPDSVHALLAGRIDALPWAEKLVLQEAAVVGKEFWAAPFRHRLPDIDVDDALLGLESRGLIVTRPTSAIAGETEYLFRHVLVKDVAYAELSLARRARAHADMAAWTEQLVAERHDEFIELVAWHYWRAVAGEEADLAWSDDSAERERLRLKAFRSLIGAGKVVRSRYAISRALELHGLASDLAATTAERVEALEAIGDDHAAAYHGEEAVAAYLDAKEVAEEESATAPERPRLTMKAAREAMMKSGTFAEPVRPDTLEGWVDQALSEQTDEWTRAWLLGLRADLSLDWVALTGQDPVPLEERIRSGEEAIRSAHDLGVRELQSFVGGTMILLARLAGDYERAVDLTRERLAIPWTSSSREAGVLFSSGLWLGELTGAWEEAEELARRSREIAVSLSRHELMHTTAALITSLYFLGRWTEALEVLSEHLEAFTGEANVTCGWVRSGLVIGALIHGLRGEATDARRLLDRVPRITRMEGFPDGGRALAEAALGNPQAGLVEVERHLNHPRTEDRGWVCLAWIEALAQLGRWEELGPALEVARGQAGGFSGLRPAIDRIAGARFVALGDPGRAELALRKALETARSLGMPFEIARAGEALAAVVGGDEGAGLLAEVLGIYEQLGAKPAIERIRGVSVTGEPGIPARS